MRKKIRPISRIVKIETEINRIVGEVFSDRQKILGLDESWAPCVDVAENDNEIVVEIELPGIKERDVTVMLSSNRIEVKGMKAESRFRKPIKYMRLEREYGPFRRLIFLPSAVIPEKARATLENGILTLNLKKYRISKSREVVLEIQKSED